MTAREFNFDGLVGPTHNYSGLSLGNVASHANQGNISNPKEAAKQGLRKMKALHDIGLAQAVLPPQERPSIGFLKRCGFSGSETEIIEKAFKTTPDLFRAACSASSMWTANAATVSPSADTEDQKLHLTPANLINKLHRSIEDKTTSDILKAIFSDQEKFQIHEPLPHHESLGDEGAANHTRLCRSHYSTGLEIFVYGQHFFNKSSPKPTRFPARQTLEASQSIIRSHKLKDKSSLLAQQNPNVIDQGVFHNDVIAVGNENVLFYHQQAFWDEEALKARINDFFADNDFYFIRVNDDQVTVEQAVKSYLFNSQIVTLPDNTMAFILPQECQESAAVWDCLQEIKDSDNPIDQLIVKDLRQSMANGGGPACLRLRAVLTEAEAKAINRAVIIDEKLFERLDQWVDKHYRDRLDYQSLADSQLLVESRTALDELTGILNLGSIYPFQQ